ncbi:hypothetical protein NHF40_11225 [Maricaulaceae bacterium EIL42A08]|nr:hypothetical protein [Maricaulaceae bacterium EIL42A08]
MFRVLFAGSCLALSVGAGPALAQEADSARSELMARCAQIESDAARLACFDMAMRGGVAAARRAIEEVNRANPSAPVGTGTAPRMPASAPSTASGTQAQAENEAGEFGRESGGGLNLPGLPSVSVPSLPDFGRAFEGGADLADAEQSGRSIPDTQILERDADGDPDRVLMVVDRMSTHGYNTKRFHMTNGQVWEVTDGFRFSVPRNTDEMTAEIRTAGAGGYFLRLNGEGRAIRVRRID